MISVITSTRYASEVLELHLQSIMKYQKEDNEIIVVADSPSWQVLKLLQDMGFVLGGTNHSYHIVNHQHLEMNWNYGAQFAKHDYFSFTCDDAVIGPDWDAETLKAMGGSKRKIIFLRSYQRCTPVDHPGYRDFGVPEWKYSEGHRINRSSPIGHWNWEKFEQECRHIPFVSPEGIFWTFHRELFNLIHGYTFHAAHPLGQELSLFGACRELFGATREIAQNTGAFHWGSAGSSDSQKSHVGISNGWFECTICKHRDPGVHPSLYNKDPRSVLSLRTGLYLCERCKMDGWQIVGHELRKS